MRLGVAAVAALAVAVAVVPCVASPIGKGDGLVPVPSNATSSPFAELVKQQHAAQARAVVGAVMHALVSSDTGKALLAHLHSHSPSKSDALLEKAGAQSLLQRSAIDNGFFFSLEGLTIGAGILWGVGQLRKYISETPDFDRQSAADIFRVLSDHMDRALADMRTRKKLHMYHEWLHWKDWTFEQMKTHLDAAAKPLGSHVTQHRTSDTWLSSFVLDTAAHMDHFFRALVEEDGFNNAPNLLVHKKLLTAHLQGNVHGFEGVQLANKFSSFFNTLESGEHEWKQLAAVGDGAALSDFLRALSAPHFNLYATLTQVRERHPDQASLLRPRVFASLLQPLRVVPSGKTTKERLVARLKAECADMAAQFVYAKLLFSGDAPAEERNELCLGFGQFGALQPLASVVRSCGLAGADSLSFSVVAPGFGEAESEFLGTLGTPMEGGEGVCVSLLSVREGLARAVTGGSDKSSSQLQSDVWQFLAPQMGPEVFPSEMAGFLPTLHRPLPIDADEWQLRFQPPPEAKLQPEQWEAWGRVQLLWWDLMGGDLEPRNGPDHLQKTVAETMWTQYNWRKFGNWKKLKSLLWHKASKALGQLTTLRDFAQSGGTRSGVRMYGLTSGANAKRLDECNVFLDGLQRFSGLVCATEQRTDEELGGDVTVGDHVRNKLGMTPKAFNWLSDAEEKPTLSGMLQHTIRLDSTGAAQDAVKALSAPVDELMFLADVLTRNQRFCSWIDTAHSTESSQQLTALRRYAERSVSQVQGLDGFVADMAGLKQYLSVRSSPSDRLDAACERDFAKGDRVWLFSGSATNDPKEGVQCWVEGEVVGDPGDMDDDDLFALRLVDPHLPDWFAWTNDEVPLELRKELNPDDKIATRDRGSLEWTIDHRPTLFHASSPAVHNAYLTTGEFVEVKITDSLWCTTRVEVVPAALMPGAEPELAFPPKMCNGHPLAGARHDVIPAHRPAPLVEHGKDRVLVQDFLTHEYKCWNED